MLLLVQHWGTGTVCAVFGGDPSKGPLGPGIAPQRQRRLVTLTESKQILSVLEA